MKVKYKRSIVYTLPLLTWIAVSLLMVNLTSNSTSATTLSRTASTTAAIRVKSTCSMTATIEPGEEHAATMINGQYRNDIGLTTIQTFCNDPNGYAIYAIGYTGGDEGIAEGTNTVLHSNALGSTYDIITGTSTNGLDNDDTSNWAMKLTALGTTDTYRPNILSDDNGTFSDYHIIPSTYTKVASYPTATDLDNPASTRLGSNLTTTYAAYISNTQPAGTYEGQVKYVLVHPSTIDTNHYYMQDVEGWGNLLAVGQEVTAYDIRDGKSYTVRRMCMEGTGDTWQEKEAHCAKSMLWMTQNLDLDLSKNVELTSEDTDINIINNEIYHNGYRQDSSGIIYWLPKLTTGKNINTSTGAFYNWPVSVEFSYSVDPDAVNSNNSWYTTGETYDSNLCYIDYNGETCNYLNSNNTVAPNYFSHDAFISNGNHGKLGNYYGWLAAVASSGGMLEEKDTMMDAQNSICPKGWRLPTTITTAKDEFAKLNNTYNNGSTSSGNGLIDSPIYMTRSGIVRTGALYYSGYGGFYWSGTLHSYNLQRAVGLYFRSFNVINRYTAYVTDLLSVRCVSEY